MVVVMAATVGNAWLHTAAELHVSVTEPQRASQQHPLEPQTRSVPLHTHHTPNAELLWLFWNTCKFQLQLICYSILLHPYLNSAVLNVYVSQ